MADEMAVESGDKVPIGNKKKGEEKIEIYQHQSENVQEKKEEREEKIFLAGKFCLNNSTLAIELRFITGSDSTM
jgi:hypothetical protein